MSDYKPKVGDRVRVVLEGEVESVDSGGSFDLKHNWINPDGNDTLVSIEKVEPGAVLPDGLTISEDGSLLNWLGENYVRQPAEKTVEVFKPGDVVRSTGYPEHVYTLGKDGYYSHMAEKFYEPCGPFTSAEFELVYRP